MDGNDGLAGATGLIGFAALGLAAGHDPPLRIASLARAAAPVPVQAVYRPPARRFRGPPAAGLVALGIADQTPGTWFREYVVEDVEPHAARFRADRDFFTRVEAAAPEARVFCLPYMPFPEVPPVHNLKAYEHARVYLHTDTLVTGYGAMKFREADEWLRGVAFQGDPAVQLVRLVARGFDGVLVDGRGYLTQAEANQVVQGFRTKAAPAELPQVIHEDGRQVFLDLRPFRDWLRGKDPALFEREATREREYVALCFIRGFPANAPYGLENHHRWAYRSAAFQIVNPSDRTRVFDLSATFDTHHGGTFSVRLYGPTLTRVLGPDAREPLDDRFEVVGVSEDGRPGRSDRRAYRLEVPPGRHTVRATSVAPPYFISGDTRPIHYSLRDITFTEVQPR
jgi:hypothetical protein